MTIPKKTYILLLTIIMQIEYLYTIDQLGEPVKRQKISNSPNGFKTIPTRYPTNEHADRMNNKPTIEGPVETTNTSFEKGILISNEASAWNQQQNKKLESQKLQLQTFSNANKTEKKIVATIVKAISMLEKQSVLFLIKHTFLTSDLFYFPKDIASVLDICNPSIKETHSALPSSAIEFYKLLIEPINFRINFTLPNESMGQSKYTSEQLTNKLDANLKSTKHNKWKITLKDVTNLLYLPFLAEHYKEKHFLYLKFFESNYNPSTKDSYIKKIKHSLKKFKLNINEYNAKQSNNSQFETKTIKTLKEQLDKMSKLYKLYKDNGIKNDQNTEMDVDENEDKETPHYKLDVNKNYNSNEWEIVYEPGFEIPYYNAMTDKSIANTDFNTVSEFLISFFNDVYGWSHEEVLERILKALYLNEIEMDNLRRFREVASTKVMRGLTLFINYIERVNQLIEVKKDADTSEEDKKLLQTIKNLLTYLLEKTNEEAYSVSIINEHFNKSVGLLEFYKYIENKQKDYKEDTEMQEEISMNNETNPFDNNQRLEFDTYCEDDEECQLDAFKEDNIDIEAREQKVIKITAVDYITNLIQQKPTTMNSLRKIKLYYKRLNGWMHSIIHLKTSLPDGTNIEW